MPSAWHQEVIVTVFIIMLKEGAQHTAWHQEMLSKSCLLCFPMPPTPHSLLSFVLYNQFNLIRAHGNVLPPIQDVHSTGERNEAYE